MSENENSLADVGDEDKDVGSVLGAVRKTRGVPPSRTTYDKAGSPTTRQFPTVRMEQGQSSSHPTTPELYHPVTSPKNARSTKSSLFGGTHSYRSSNAAARQKEVELESKRRIVEMKRSVRNKKIELEKMKVMLESVKARVVVLETKREDNTITNDELLELDDQYAKRRQLHENVQLMEIELMGMEEDLVDDIDLVKTEEEVKMLSIGESSDEGSDYGSFPNEVVHIPVTTDNTHPARSTRRLTFEARQGPFMRTEAWVVDDNRRKEVVTERRQTDDLNHVPTPPQRVTQRPSTPPTEEPVTMNTLASLFQNVIGNNSNSKNVILKQSVDKDLPRFYGNPIRWAEFKSAYEKTTVKYKYDFSENLARIRKALGGDALKAVRNMFGDSDNTPKIMETLEKEFGRPEQVMEMLMEEAEKAPSADPAKAESVIEFGRIVYDLVTTATSLKQYSYLHNPFLVKKLEEKLNIRLRTEWLEWTRSGFARQRDLMNFSVWIEEKMDVARLLSKKVSQKDEEKEEKSVRKRGPGPGAVHAVSSDDDEKCPCCSKKKHALRECWTFAKKNPEERWKLVKDVKVCFCCLEKGHRTSSCEKKTDCGVNGCHKLHHKLLHNDSRPSVQEGKRLPEVTTPEGNDSLQMVDDELRSPGKNTEYKNFGSMTVISGSRFQAIIPVKVNGTNGRKTKYLLADSGATDTCIMKNAAEELGLDGPACQYTYTVANGKTITEDSQKVECDIQGLFRGAPRIHLKNVVTVNQLQLQPYTLDLEKLREDYPHLRRIKGKSMLNVVPDMVVGMDNLQHLVAKQVVRGPPDAPIAARCDFGWIIGGVSNNARNGTMCVLQSQDLADEKLHYLVKEFFTLENLGVRTTKKKMTVEVERAEDILEKTTIFLPNEKRYETGLLYSNENVNFPQSYNNALQRLEGIERKMSRDPAFASLYSSKFDEYLEKEYISIVPEQRGNDLKTWFVPHFGVTSPNKPGKLRLVFDAAAKVKDVSLSNQLLPGKDRMLRIDEALMNVRRYDIILTGDINEMFHRVKVRKEDRQSQQFLWRNGESWRKPDVYQMNVLIFGAPSSPTTAIYILNKNAERFRDDFPRAVEAVQMETYMDDCLTGGNNEDEVNQLRKDISHICGEGGFIVAKWQSNSRCVLATIPKDLRAESTKEILEKDEWGTERMLGMWIDYKKDVFTFVCRFHKVDPAIIQGKQPTKREMCKLVMSLFDPLGLIGHFKVKGLMLLQSTWRSGIGWDDEVPDDIFSKWTNWIHDLKKIEEVEVPRRYAPMLQDAVDVQLHTFVDASTEGYASVCYLRSEVGGEVFVALVGSRTRVAPMKKQTIVRLELLSAQLGVRLAKHVKQILKITIHKRSFWSDNRTVLTWIKSDAYKYKEFVGNRISEIQEDSDPSEWKWIPTDMNVADDATRFEKITDFSPQARWFTGPDFLKKSADTWPKSREDDNEENMEESFPAVFAVTCGSYESWLNFERFSSWNRLVRTVSGAIAAARFWRKRSHKSEPWKLIPEAKRDKMTKSKYFSTMCQRDLNEAEAVVIVEVQRTVFGEELKCLGESKPLPKKSQLRKIRVEKKDDGLIRVKGRISAAVVHLCVKMPAVLPKDHHVTALIIENEHKKNAHVGQETVFNNLRQRYWILGGRATVRRICLLCQECKNKKAKPIVPEMGNLPWYRLAHRQPAFTFTGCDYFGPLEATVGRHREKRWGCLFVCLVTRAVHLEVAHGLTSDEMIMCLSRFVDTRGKPRLMVSDNGTNLVGANRELKEALAELDMDRVVSSPKFEGLEWRFIPPAAPNFGGAWESLVKSVKSAIYNLMKEKHPRDQVLLTVFKGAENIVNSRPLCHVSGDPEDPESLTPNHFLRGGFDAGPSIPGKFEDSDEFRRKQWRLSQLLIDQFWTRWTRDYLPTLVRARKWTEPTVAIQLGELVFIVDELQPRNQWTRGIVTKTFPGHDGIVRVVEVTCRDVNGNRKLTYKRPVSKVCPIGVKVKDLGSIDLAP